MKIIRILNQRKMEFELSPDELFLAHQEYMIQINQEYIIGWITEYYQLNNIQQNRLKQSKELLAKLCEEKQIQTDKYHLEEEEATMISFNKYKEEIKTSLGKMNPAKKINYEQRRNI